MLYCEGPIQRHAAQHSPYGCLGTSGGPSDIWYILGPFWISDGHFDRKVEKISIAPQTLYCKASQGECESFMLYCEGPVQRHGAKHSSYGCLGTSGGPSDIGAKKSGHARHHNVGGSKQLLVWIFTSSQGMWTLAFLASAVCERSCIKW